jgi:hypothetical protein
MIPFAGRIEPNADWPLVFLAVCFGVLIFLALWGLAVFLLSAPDTTDDTLEGDRGQPGKQ